MNTRAARAIKTVITAFPEEGISEVFLSRLRKGALTRDENLENHFCVYFAGYDPEVKEIFMGHHKKRVYQKSFTKPAGSPYQLPTSSPATPIRTKL